MKIKLLLTFCISTTILSSCAAIFSGTKDKIYINTTPPGAEVFIDGVRVGKSNQEIVLKRKYADQRQVLLKLEGHQDLSFQIDQKIATAYYLNLPLMLAGLVPGIVGFGVDIASGSALKPIQTEYNYNFVPIEKK